MIDTTARWWAVSWDGDPEFFVSRAKAREYAGWLRGHPAMRDRRSHGPYIMGGATGAVRVVDLGCTSTPRRDLRRVLDEE